MVDHVGVHHREVLKFHFQAVKSEVKKPRVETVIEEMESDVILTSLHEDLDSAQDDVTEDKEKEAVTKLKQFLEKARSSQKVFLQNAPCYLMPDQSLHACHECRKIISNREIIISSGTCCCFEGFRKLRFINDSLTVFGYLDPVKDPKPADVELWSVDKIGVNDDLTEKLALFILSKVGGLLCNMVTEEKIFRSQFLKSGKKIVWRRQHQGIDY